MQPEWINYNQSVVDTSAHRALAKDAADQSLVLLKNDAKALPLQPRDKLTLAVMGREAQATTNMQGNYYGTAPFLVSPVKGLESYAKVISNDGSDISKSVEAVKSVDAVILVVGLQSEGAKPADEAEGHDRTSLLLPGNQDDLVEKVSAAAATEKKKTIVVVMGGGPVDISKIKQNPNVDAIMWCGYPGQSGGDAIAGNFI